MARKNKKSNTSKRLLLLVIVLAVLLVVSRTCRLTGNGREEARFFEHNKTEEIQLSESLDNSNNFSDQPMQTIQPDIPTLLGQISSPSASPLFTPIEIKYASREGMYMHKEAYDAFVKMHQHALNEGVELKIISAFRTFNHQKRIWDNKWEGRQVLSGNIHATSIPDPLERALEILRFSAMPGTSRHHWGTDIDINSLNNTYFTSGRGLREFQWLQENAGKYGFCQPYTRKGDTRNAGYEEEKWHWSYMPVASIYLQAYSDSVTYRHLENFMGWETAHQLDVIKNYVLSIDKSCLTFQH